MAEFEFTCSYCGETSGFGRRAAQTQADGSANPYAKETRKYRCEACSRINDVERTAYDWTRIDRESG